MRKLKCGGQSSLEYMVMLALALGIFSAILLTTSNLLSSSRSQIGVDAASRAIDDLVEASDFVYVHGHPSKLVVRIYVPPNINALTIQDDAGVPAKGRVFNAKLDIAPSYTEVYGVTRGFITGIDLDRVDHEGYYNIEIESVDDDEMTITVVT